MVISEDELLCYAATHTDVHLGQQLSSCLTPAVVLWEQRHLQDRTQDGRYELMWFNYQENNGQMESSRVRELAHEA